MIKIYTDSSFNERHGVAGIGVVIQAGENKKILSNWARVPNNNIGEIYAVWFALNVARKYTGPVTIYTDSMTAIYYINGEARPDKRKATPEQIRNRLELKKWAYRINRIMPPDCKIEHVKAHTGKYNDHSINNAMADLAAKNGFFHYLQNNTLGPVNKKSNNR